eukprot:CFRG8330T1
MSTADGPTAKGTNKLASLSREQLELFVRKQQSIIKNLKASQNDGNNSSTRAVRASEVCEQDIADAKQRATFLEKELDANKGQLQRSEELVSSLQTELDEVKLTLQEQTKSNTNGTNDELVVSLEAQLKKTEEGFAHEKAKFSALQKRCGELQTKLKEIVKERKVLKTELQEAKENAVLPESVADVHELRRLQDELQATKEQVKKVLNEKDEETAALKGTVEKIAVVEAERHDNMETITELRKLVQIADNEVMSTRAEMETLRENCLRLESEKVNLSDELKELAVVKAELKDSMDTTAELRKQVNIADDEVTSTRAEMATLRENCSRLESEKVNLSQELEELAVVKAELKDSMDTAAELRKQMNIASDESTSTSAEVETQKENCSRLESEKSKLIQELAVAKESTAAKDRDLATIKEAANETELELRSIVGKISEKDTHITTLKAEVEHHKSRLMEITEKNETLRVAVESAGETGRIVDELTEELDSAKAELDGKEQLICHLTEDAESADGQLAKLQTEVEHLKIAQGSLKDELHDAKARIADMDEQEIDLKNTIEALNVDLADLRSSSEGNSNNESVINSLMVDLDEREKAMRECQEETSLLRTELDKMKTQVDEKEVQAMHLNSKIETANLEITELGLKITELQNANADHVSTLNDKNEEIGILTVTIENLRSACDTTADTNTLLSTLKSDIEERDESMRIMQLEMSELQASSEAASLTMTERDEQIGRLNMAMESQSMDLKAARDEIDKLQGVRNERETAQEQLNALQSTLKDRDIQLKNLEAQLSDLYMSSEGAATYKDDQIKILVEKTEEERNRNSVLSSAIEDHQLTSAKAKAELEQALDLHREQTEVLQTEITRLQDLNTSGSEGMAKQAMLLERLIESIRGYNSEFNKFRDDSENVENQLSVILTQVVETESARGSASVVVTEGGEQIIRLQSEIAKLIELLSTLQQIAAHERKKEVVKRDTMLAEKCDHILSIETTITELNETMRTYAATALKDASEIKHLREDVAFKSDKLLEVQGEIATMKSVMESNHDARENDVTIDEVITLRQDIQECNTLINTLEAKVSELQAAKDETYKAMSEENSQIDVLKAELEAKTVDLSSANAEVDELTSTVPELRNAVDGASVNVTKTEKALSDCKIILEDKEMEISALVREKTDGEAKLAELTVQVEGLHEGVQDRASEMDSLRDTIETLQKDILEMTQQRDDLQTRLEFMTEQTNEKEEESAGGLKKEELTVIVQQQTDTINVLNNNLSDLERSAQVRIDEFQNKIAELESELGIATSNAANIKEMSEKLESERAANEQRKIELDEVRQKLITESSNKEEVQNKLNKMTAELTQSGTALQVAKTAAAGNDVLSLEISDHVRTADKLQSQLNDTEQKLAAVTVERDALNKTGGQLKKAAEAVKKLKMMVKQARAETENEKEKTIEVIQKETEAMDKVTALQIELDELKLELAQAVADYAKVENRYDTLQQIVERQRHEATESTRIAEDELGRVNERLTETLKDFESYKVRAQTVLREKAQAIRDSTETNNPLQIVSSGGSIFNSLNVAASNGIDMDPIALSEEINDLEMQLENLSAQHEDAKSQISKLYYANSQLRDSLIHHEEKEKQHQKLEARIQEMSVSLARAQLQSNKSQSRTVVDESKNMLGPLKEELAAEQALVCNLKEQVERQQETIELAREETNDLQDRLRASEHLVERLHTQEELLRDMVRRAENSTKIEHVSSNPNMTSDTLPAINSPVSSEPQTSSNHTIDLDRLLSYKSSTPPESPRLAQRKSSFGNNSNMAQAAQQKYQQFLAAQKTITHLRELVSELEAHGMRMEQQQDLLKEEIRRLERNQARHESFNLEYLKQVLFSFLEAQEEKTRKPFLQVFAQMLKFSPEEMEKLQQSYAVFETTRNRPATPTTWPGLSFFS